MSDVDPLFAIGAGIAIGMAIVIIGSAVVSIIRGWQGK
jgi:hypothetical protein